MKRQSPPVETTPASESEHEIVIHIWRGLLNGVYIRGQAANAKVTLYDEDAYEITPPGQLLPRKAFESELIAITSDPSYSHASVRVRADDK
jgi:hypothetical protein